jgi:hypothetical protein
MPPRTSDQRAPATNLARSNQSLVLRGPRWPGAKSCALVNLFMICPRWSAGGQQTTTKFCPWIAAVSWLSTPLETQNLETGYPKKSGNPRARTGNREKRGRLALTSGHMAPPSRRERSSERRNTPALVSWAASPSAATSMASTVAGLGGAFSQTESKK